MSMLSWLRCLNCRSSPPDTSASAGRRSASGRFPSSCDRLDSSVAHVGGGGRSAARGLRRAAAALLLGLPLLLGLAAGAQAQADTKVWLSTDVLSGDAYSLNAGWGSCGFWPPGPWAKPVVDEGDKVCGAVRLSSARSTDTMIALNVSGGTATSGTDYTAGPYTVIIPAGKTRADFQIQTTQDDTLEAPDETFNLEIDASSLPAGVTRSSDSGRNYKFEVIIEDDEYTLTFDLPSYSVREDAGEVALTLTYSRPTPRAGTVKFLYTDTTATAGADYTEKNAWPKFLHVLAGTEKITLRIPIHIDDMYENNELFSIKAEPSEIPPGHLASSTQVIITAVDPDVEFRASAFTAHEGRDAVVTFRVVDNLTDTLLALRKPVTLHVAAKSSSTATAGTDYAAGPWTLTIPKGASRGVLRIPIHADSASDGGETIDLEIKRTTGSELADASGTALSGHEHVRTSNPALSFSIGPEATVTINDGAGTGPGTPVVWIEPASSQVTEGTDASFTLKADPAPLADLDVSIHVDDATQARHVADEDLGLQTATIAAGSDSGTFTVTTQAAPGTGAVRVVLMSPDLLFATLEPDYSVGKPSVALVGVDGPAPSSAPPIQVPNTSVTGVQVSAVDDASASVTWDAVPHATSYSVEWEGESADQQDYINGFKSVTVPSATFDHNAPQAMTLTVTVTPEYLDGNGGTLSLAALAGTATLDVGPGATQSGDTQTTAPNACVSAELQSDVEGYAKENYGDAHVARWKKVLKTFAGETGGMTGTEARQMEKKYKANRWGPVAEAIECLEAASQPASVPEIAVSGGAGVTEGDPASFTVTANPAPSAPLTVTLTVGQSGDVAAAGATGSREVVVPTGGSVTLDIATVDDGTDEPDGSVSVTLAAGDGYTVAASPDDAASVAVADDDTAANQYAALIAKMVEWRNDPQWASHRSHTDRWDRALLAFGESVSDSSLTPMTAAEAQSFADRGMTRWVEVAKALHEIESGGTVTPDPVPVVTVSGGAGVTEGDPASFTVTANPAPAAPLTVTLTVGQSGDVAAAGATGSREIEIPTGGSVTLDIATVDDGTDEPDGSVSVTVDAGNGYTVGSANAHTVSVADDDGPAAAPELSLTAGSAVDEGGNAEFTINASPAPQAALTVEFTVAQSGDYLDAPQPASRTVTLAAGATSTTLTLATVEDGTDEADGSVSVTIDAGNGYTVAAGQDTGTVTVRDNDEPVVGIAAGNGVTEGDPASFTVTADPTPAAPLTITLTVGQSGDYAATGQTGSREVTVPTGGSVTVEVATDDDSADEPDGSITATLAAGNGYTVAASPDDTATVAVADNDEAAGVPSLSVVDGEANENEGRLPVVIRLSPPSKSKVTVWAKTRESNPVSARAGVDYRAWNARWGIRIDFRPGETERRLAVGLLNDSHDEDAETFEVVLSDPSGGAAIADGTGVMTIVNSDPMPAAWLARFGRTVAEQALDGIAGRMAAPRTAGAQGTIAGQALSFGPGSGSGTGGGDPDGSGAANDNAALGSVGLTDSGSLAQSDVARAFGASGDRFGASEIGGSALGFGTGGTQPQPQGMTGLEALLGSSFTATGEKDGAGGSMAFWGRAAQSRFDGREGTFSLDGETTTAMLGADYARGRWLVGMALMQSSGEGGYADPGSGSGAGSGTGPQACPEDADPAYLCDKAVREGDGKVEASLTAAVPYAAIQASERLKLWGALGYGTGEVTLKPEMGGALSSDISWTMASMGLRGDLLPPPKEGSGPALAVTSDALWARTSSEKTSELAASDSDVTRLRLGLEGSWRIATEGGGSLTPKLEIGARHDGGDAETGFGIELGGGLAWMDPRLGLSLDLSGRTLVAHGSDDLEDRGFAASMVFDPDPASARGPSLTLTQDWGGQAKGGLDALFRTDPLTDRPGSGPASESRWQAEAAWGFPAFSGRFTGSPHVGLGLATAARDYSLGWRLTPAAPSTGSGQANANAPDVSFGLKATRRESATAPPEHTVWFKATARW